MAFPPDARWQLSPKFVSLCRSSDRLVLCSEEEVRCIDEPVCIDLLEALDRPRSLEEVEQRLVGRHALDDIRAALRSMAGDRVIGSVWEGNRNTAAYWDSLECEPPHGELAFRPLCSEAAGLIPHAVKAINLTVSDSAPFLLVTTDDYLRPELAEINRREHPWLLAKPVGHTIWIGPLFIPGKTACWACLAAWMKPHRWAQAAFYGWGAQRFPPQPSVASLPTTTGLAAGIIATTLAVWFARGAHEAMENTVVALDTRTLRQSRNEVRRRPDCPHCGPGQPSAVPAGLHSFVSPITSIVSKVHVTDQPVGGLFHARADFAAPLPKSSSRLLLRAQRAAGKGYTAEEAQFKAIAESLERYSLIHRGDEPVVRGKARGEMLMPEEILLFSDAQYEDREAWNRSHSELHWVPERFDPNSETDWTEVKAVRSPGAAKYLPAALCYMDYPFADAPRFCAADSNGCAAGASLTDAILAALLELIERDAVAIWWYNRLHRPLVNLASFEDRRFPAFEESFATLGRQLYVLDVTTDLRVPAYVAVAPKSDGSEPCFGAAADTSAEAAVLKAVSEVSQICFWTSTGSGSAELLSWMRRSKLQEQAYLRPHGEIDCQPGGGLDPSEALAYCAARLTEAGIEAYYADLTRPEVGLPVVRCVAPSLRHFWCRLGPGRLYDVPARMGWLEAPLAESQMNPVPCMI